MICFTLSTPETYIIHPKFYKGNQTKKMYILNYLSFTSFPTCWENLNLLLLLIGPHDRIKSLEIIYRVKPVTMPLWLVMGFYHF